MPNILNKFFTQNSILRSSTTLIWSSVGAQIITLLISPILTRLFTPEDFGLYTLVSTAATMFGPILSLRYDISIVTEEDNDSVKALVKISIIICIVLSIIVSIGYFIYFSFIQFKDMNPYLVGILIFLLCLLTGFLNILISFNNRQKEFGLLASVYFIRITTQNAANIIFGLLKTGGLGLLLSQIISNLIGVRRQSRSLIRTLSGVRNVKWALILSTLKKHKRQVTWSAPAAFLNSFSYSSINYFVQFLFGGITLGYYSISYRVLALPMILVSANISKVFFEKGSREIEETGSFMKSFDMTLKLMVFIAIPILIIMILFAPWIFGFVFGNEWRVAGEYVQILTPMFILRFVAGGVVFSATIAERQNIDLIIQLSLTSIIIICSLLATLLKLDIKDYLMIINISSSIIYIIYIILLRDCAKGKSAHSIKWIR